MLIGRGGRVSGDKGPIGISSLALEETLGTIVRRHQPPGAPCEWVDVVPGGAPALTWTTDWLPATSADALGTWLASFHQALLTTGLFAPHNPRLAIDIQTPGQPTRTLTGFANPDQWPQYKAMAQKETTTKQPRATTHKHAEVWYWDKQHNVALWGWMPPPPYEVEGLCPLPTDEVAREEPLSRTYAQPYTNAARHIGAKEPTEDHELTIHWGWREKWEMRGQLSQDVIDGLITTGRVPLFEQMHALNPKHPPQVWGELLVRWPRGLQRKGCPIQHLSDERWMSIAALHGMGLCQREGLRDLLAFAAYFPDQPVRDLLRHKMGIAPLPPAKLKKQLPQLIAGPLPRATLWPARERFWMGRLMSQLKGAVPGKTVRKELYRLFSTQPPTPMDRCPFPPPSKKRKRS